MHFYPGFTPRATTIPLLTELGFTEMSGVVVKSVARSNEALMCRMEIFCYRYWPSTKAPCPSCLFLDLIIKSLYNLTPWITHYSKLTTFPVLPASRHIDLFLADTPWHFSTHFSSSRLLISFSNSAFVISLNRPFVLSCCVSCGLTTHYSLLITHYSSLTTHHFSRLPVFSSSPIPVKRSNIIRSVLLLQKQ